MSRYKGLFTFDVDNHRYIPVEQADGLISDMNYHPEPDEEPKRHWIIDTMNDRVEDFDVPMDFNESIGNYFSSREEAELAISKLKAWKRLKDKGFRFTGWEDLETLDIEDSLLINRDVVDGACVVGFRMNNYENCIGDLDLLFGGKE